MSGGLAKAIQEVDGKIVSVRTGTVVTNNAALSDTMVSLDKDPTNTPVAALALTIPFPAGTRVLLLSYPTGGLVILGAMQGIPAVAPLISGAASFTYWSSSTFTSANAAPFRSIIIETRAAGGSGAGAPTSTAGNSSGGGGGGGGGYARRVASTAGRTYPLQVNVPGTTVGGSGVAGSTGGSASVVENNGAGTVLCRALGGGGGAVLANGAALWGQSAGALGGSADVGDYGLTGGQGARSSRTQATTVFFGAGGNGAMGGQGGLESGAGGANASDGQNYGGGGAGAHATNGNGPFIGGDGAQGLVTIIGIP